MGMSYVSGNLINSNTLDSVSSERSIYPKENMFGERQSFPWRMTEKTSQFAIFNFGTGRPDIICILNHNFDPTVVLTLKAASDPPNWGAPAWSQVISYHKQNIYYVFSQDYPWFKLEIEDGNNNFLPEIGELIFSNKSQFTRNFEWPYSHGVGVVKTGNITPWGHRWSRKKAKKKKFDLFFQHYPNAELISEAEAFFNILDGEDHPFIFIPDESENDCWYMYVLNDYLIETKFKIKGNSFSMTLEEQSRGIKMI